jgi:hypothetical protein
MGFVLLGRPAGVSSLALTSAPIRQPTVCKRFKVVKVISKAEIEESFHSFASIWKI